MRNVTIKNIGLIISLLPLMLPGKTAQAQVYPEQYLQQARENNPGLRAQHLEWEAARKQADISGSLPDPVLTAGFFISPMERFMGNQWFDVGLMQMFPWFGTLERQREVADKIAESRHHQYREERNRLFMEMTRLWLEMVRKQQEWEIIQEYRKLLASREDLIYSRYQGGMQTQGLALDIHRLEIRLAELQNREEKLASDLKSLGESFNLLIGRETGATIEIPSGLPEYLPERLPEHQYLQEAGSEVLTREFAGNPRLQYQEERSRAAQANQALSRLQTRPMLGIGLQYSWLAPGKAPGQMDGGHMFMPMVSVSLPVFRNKNQASHDQAGLLYESAQRQYDEELVRLQVQYSKLLNDTDNLLRDKVFYNRQMDITRKTWDLVINAYASGDEGFEELLNIQDQLLLLEWRLVENQVNYYMTLAEMDKLMARNIFE
jgi:outer membrane protein, heavy metal efflux system